jgi:hypothetical protein
MKKINLIIIFFSILLNNFIFLNLQSQINNSIVVKVGQYLITSIDVQNEIITNLLINQQEITQENINSNKNYALKNLINKSIKRSEINKYEIKDYNEKDLQNYIKRISETLNTDGKGLKNLFDQNNIDYEAFVEKHRLELIWNTLIFQLYANQTNVNIVDVNNEIEKIKENKSTEELKKIKQSILNEKKEKKLNLFSRSHFSKLENTININFNE